MKPNTTHTDEPVRHRWGKTSTKAVAGAANLLGGFLFVWSGYASAGNVVTYYLTDPQGSVLATTDDQGTITATREFRPYGAAASGDSVVDGVGYTGHIGDDGTGLIYMQARYYSAEIGRFMSVDPIGPAPAKVEYFNRFSYVGNNPVNRIDPSGRYYCKSEGGCTQFDAAYAKLKDAAGAYSSHSSEGKAFAAVLGYYGDKGQNGSNGSVNIQEGRTSLGNPAEIGHNSLTGTDTITFNFSSTSKLNTPLIESAGLIAHEGQHGVDDGIRRKAGRGENDDTVRATERNAYRIQSYVSQSFGVNSAYSLWRSDWPSDEVESRRNSAVEAWAQESWADWKDQ
jgi:RHS repeat-associated protein